MDSRRARQGIGHCHLKDEPPNVVCDRWSPWSSSVRVGEPGPEPPKPITLPPQHGIRLDKDQCVAPILPDGGKADPKPPIALGQKRPFPLPPICGKLTP